MPFTPTHALAIVPLRRHLPLPALVVGSMVPDFPLYFPVGLAYATTHSPLGIVTACLPLGLLIYLLLEQFVREPVMALAPATWRGRVWPARHGAQPWHNWAMSAIAITLGAITHVVWDAFTHLGRWGTQMIPALGREYEIGPLTAHGFSLFQHGSSVVGLPLLAVLVWRMAAGRTNGSAHVAIDGRRRAGIVAALVLVPAARGAIAAANARSDLGARLYEFVTVGGRWFVLGVLIYALIFRWRRVWFCAAPVSHTD